MNCGPPLQEAREPFVARGSRGYGPASPPPAPPLEELLADVLLDDELLAAVLLLEELLADVLLLEELLADVLLLEELLVEVLLLVLVLVLLLELVLVDAPPAPPPELALVDALLAPPPELVVAEELSLELDPPPAALLDPPVPPGIWLRSTEAISSQPTAAIVPMPIASKKAR